MAALKNEIHFEIKAGRRIVKHNDIAYILPSDKMEVDRLKLNHELWRITLTGFYVSSLHDKLTKGIKVLDIGCGPGFWTLDMAKLYPQSQFVAIDMADVMDTDNLPSNVTFIKMNAGNGLQFPDNSFDFVFQRFLVMGFTRDQYKNTIDEIMRILVPGGSLEITELINHYTNAGPSFKNINKWINTAMEARNLDSFMASKIADICSKAGFIAIKDIDYDLPIGQWGGQLGDIFLRVQKQALPAVKVMVEALAGIDPTEYDNNLEKAFEEVDTHQISTQFRLILATKPN